jgi:hypothetical protein
MGEVVFLLLDKTKIMEQMTNPYENQRKNYEEASLEKANKKSPLINKIFGSGLTTEDVIMADAEAEKRYRSYFEEGKISEKELECLSEVNLIKSEKFNAMTDSGTVIYEGTVKGDKVWAMRKVATPIMEGDSQFKFEARNNGQEISPDEAEDFFKSLDKNNQEKNEILKRLGEKLEITDEDMAHTGYDI